MNSRNHRAKTFGYRRSGAVVVWVAVSIPVIIGFTAIGFDLSRKHSADNDIQRAADAAALAAAWALAQAETGSDLFTIIFDAAQDMADRNLVAGDVVVVEPEDISLGHVVLDATTGQYDWSAPGPNNTNAVEITLRYSVEMYFGRVIGSDYQDISATAQAMLVPRDIALVVDISKSMNNDSELGHYLDTPINLQAIWQALDSPTYGKMTTWGTNPPLDAGYSVVDDPGLVYLKRHMNWDETGRNLLESQGYNAAEVNAASSEDANDGSTTRWVNRVGVTLGLAAWHSGITDESTTPPTPPLFPEGGDGDQRVDDDVGELVWGDYPFQQGSWSGYIKDYVRKTTHTMYAANTDFQYRFGLKTFVNYLLEERPSFAETEVLFQTPEQPLQAVKDAVDGLVTIITELDSGDQMSLEVYATRAYHETDLTHTFTEVSDRLALIQANHYDSFTCIGCGLALARQELLSANARPGEAVKVIVLLTDGIANQSLDTDPGAEYPAAGLQYARLEATAAAAEHIMIHTVGVGVDADMDLMEEIADTGGGLFFHAEGTTAEYTDQLQEIFRLLGSKRSAVLIQ